jgi:hypothetical protein
MATGEAAGAGAGDESLSSETGVEVVGTMLAFRLIPVELSGVIGEVGGLKVGNLDSIAIVAGFGAAKPPELGVVTVTCDVGVAPVFGELPTLVGEFDPTGVGFIMTGVGFMMTGVGFIMGTMPTIPDAMERRSLPSSVSTEIDAHRRVLRAPVRRWSCF